MRTQENVWGVGLFGSWSRGDATRSSDVDLLIVEGGNFNYEYVERRELKGLLIDLNHIPKKWLTEQPPPELDQKLYELLPLYDRDWSLTNTTNWIRKTYHTQERVDIRTETYVINSDIYLSRATSAQAREDFESARLFAGMAVESIVKILIEICTQPLSNSNFIRTLQHVCEELKMPEIYTGYLHIARLTNMNRADAEKKLKLFKSIWDDVAAYTKKHASTLESMHPKVKAKLKYYETPAFLQGVILKSQDLTNTGAFIEAAHYIERILVEILENYAWLKSKVEGTKLDYTTLLRALKETKEQPNKLYENATKTLNLTNIDSQENNKILSLAKQIISNIRKQRKDLIKKHIKITG